MSGHGGFSAIGSGMHVPQPLDMPKVEELQPGKDKRDALNVEGHKAEVQIADTRLDQTNRLAANLDAMLLRAAKTASAPVDAQALKGTLVAAGLDKATRKGTVADHEVPLFRRDLLPHIAKPGWFAE